MIIPTGDQNDHRTRPWVTGGLVVVNVMVFLAAKLTLDDGQLIGFWRLWGFTPEQPSAVTLVTHQFVHAGWLHLIGNVLFLWIFGDNLEDWLGHVPFFFYYLTMGGLAAVTHTALTKSGAVPIVGASGAIAGVMGGYLVLLPRNRVTFWLVLWLFLYRLELPAVYAIGIYVASDLLVGLLATSDQVAHAAHLGGFFCGVAVVWLLRRSAFRPADVAQFGGVDLDEPAPRAGLTIIAAEHEDRGGGVMEAKLRALAERSDVEGLLRAYIELAGTHRRLPVSTLELARLAATLVAAGHETVGVNAIGRLLLRGPPPEIRAALEVQLAQLYAGPLRDAPRARHHATRALDTKKIRAAEARAAKAVLGSLPAATESGDDELQAVMVLDASMSARRRIARSLRGRVVAGLPQLRRGALVVPDVPARQAAQLVAALEAENLPVLRVRAADLTTPPESEPMARLRVERAGLELRSESGEIRLRWRDLDAVVASFVPTSSARSSVLRSQPASRTVGSRPQLGLSLRPSPGQGDRVGMRVRTVLDIFHGHPGGVRRLRVDERHCELDMPGAPESLPLMQQIAREILAHDELLYAAGGVAALAGLEAPDAHVCPRPRDQELHLFYWWNRFCFSGR